MYLALIQDRTSTAQFEMLCFAITLPFARELSRSLLHLINTFSFHCTLLNLHNPSHSLPNLLLPLQKIKPSTRPISHHLQSRPRHILSRHPPFPGTSKLHHSTRRVITQYPRSLYDLSKTLIPLPPLLTPNSQALIRVQLYLRICRYSVRSLFKRFASSAVHHGAGLRLQIEAERVR